MAFGSKQQKKQTILDLQRQAAQQAFPLYGQLLQQYAARAFPGGLPGAQVGGRQPGVPGAFQPPGIFGLDPAMRARLAQAEEDIGRQALQQANLLRYRLGQQGIGQGGIGAAAQSRVASDALRNLAQFRRNLAMEAGREEERRLAQLGQVIGMGTALGAQAQAAAARKPKKPSFLQQALPWASFFM